jgi:hypothetical protein
MSTLTGNDVYGLMEAYQAVYAPQELTEEQVWEEVEEWVNTLIEEGYDLSDYTWEEMFEAYINEDLIGDLRANAGNIKRGLSGAYQGAMKTASNVNKSISDRMQSNIKSVKPAPSFQQSAGFGRYGAPETQRGNQDKYKSTSDGKMYKNYNDALAANRSRNKKTDTPTSTPTTPAPAARPATPAPAAKPAATTPAKPSGTTPTAKPSSPRVKDTSITDMIGRSQLRQGAPINTGNKSSDARTIATGASVGSFQKPAAPAPARPMGSARERMLRQSFDPFDVIKGHLLDEGYADTEEAALVIMANMSEDWRESIVEAQEARNNPEKYEAEQSKKKSKKQRAMEDPYRGINSPAFAAFMKQQKGR